MEYKITKIRKYGKGVYQSEKIGTQYYNIVYAHLYRKEDQKRIKPIKVHFIHMFDNDDLCEFYNNEKVLRFDQIVNNAKNVEELILLYKVFQEMIKQGREMNIEYLDELIIVCKQHWLNQLKKMDLFDEGFTFGL